MEELNLMQGGDLTCPCGGNLFHSIDIFTCWNRQEAWPSSYLCSIAPNGIHVDAHDVVYVTPEIVLSAGKGHLS